MLELTSKWFFCLWVFLSLLVYLLPTSPLFLAPSFFYEIALGYGLDLSRASVLGNYFDVQKLGLFLSSFQNGYQTTLTSPFLADFQLAEDAMNWKVFIALIFAPLGTVLLGLWLYSGARTINSKSLFFLLGVLSIITLSLILRYTAFNQAALSVFLFLLGSWGLYCLLLFMRSSKIINLLLQWLGIFVILSPWRAVLAHYLNTPYENFVWIHAFAPGVPLFFWFLLWCAASAFALSYAFYTHRSYAYPM